MYSNRNQISICLGLMGVNTGMSKGLYRSTWTLSETIAMLIVVMAAQVYTYIEIYQIIYYISIIPQSR